MRASASPNNQSAYGLDVAGIAFDFVMPGQVLEHIQDWRRTGQSHYISITNPHSVMLCRRDPEMRSAIGGASLTLPDGAGIILAARILAYGKCSRATGPALMLELCDRGREYGYRHYFMGGADGVADRLAQVLSKRFSGLTVAGAYSPPFRQLSPQEDSALIRQINDARPDILWIGLGAPKQEKWMAKHVGRIAAAAMIGVGAAFDFHSGNVKWAPRIIRRAGLEWAWRLALNPIRMWRRNLDTPLFLWQVLLQAAGGKLRRRPQVRPAHPPIAVGTSERAALLTRVRRPGTKQSFGTQINADKHGSDPRPSASIRVR